MQMPRNIGPPYESQFFPAAEHGSHEAGFGLGPSWGFDPEGDPYFDPPPAEPVKPEPEIFGVPLKIAIPGALIAWWVLKG